MDPDEGNTVRLVGTEDLDPNNFKYATLSHRWGVPEPPKLSARENSEHSITRLEAGILSQSLPRTFRDAIKIARYCGLCYLWIDCLCIIQDKTSDGRNFDWEEEAGKMGDIYAGGVL